MACAHPNYLDANGGSNGSRNLYATPSIDAAAHAPARNRRIEELEAFVRAMAHDAGALTRGIALRAELLRDRIAGTDAPETRAIVDGIAERADRLGRMSEALLRLARLDAADLERSEIDLSSLAEAIVADLRRRHPDRSVAWIVHPGMTTQGDPPLVRLLLENLIGNAWKYTERSAAARIEFGCRGNGTDTSFYITDNGIGLPPGSGVSLFAPFVRLPSAQPYPGTGLGLVVARQIVERHGGWIRTDETAPCGAAFVFSMGSASTTPRSVDAA